MQVGTVCFSLATELSSRRLLIKTLNLGRGLYNVVGIINGTITPYMLNPTAWNWKAESPLRSVGISDWTGKTAFFWAGINLLFVVPWIYFRLPEPTGLTYGEIDKVSNASTTPRRPALSCSYSSEASQLGNSTRQESIRSSTIGRAWRPHSMSWRGK